MLTDDEIEEVEKLTNPAQDNSDAFHYIGAQDRCVVDLLAWCTILEGLRLEILESDSNSDLESYQEMGEIISRWHKEIGYRMTLIFPVR
jgi:hypothetical protein